MTSTPWGGSDYSEKVTRGIVFYGTPSHGGYHVCPTLNKTMPDHLRLESGWYEEDCDYARVVVAFPQHFKAEQISAADDSLRNWFPAAWETQHGRTLQPGESFKRDQETFHRVNAGNFIAISAVGDWADNVPAGFCGVWLKIGGRNNPHGREIAKLIPSSEYDRAGQHGYVLTPADADTFQPYAGRGIPK